MEEFNIRGWIKGKTFLVTGATGFLGKVLVEKILRECEGVQRIFVMMRARDKFELFDRFLKYKENQVFGRLNDQDLNKLHPVRGDLLEIGLGVSENDKNRLVSEVDVVVHSGASVRFNEELDYAVLLNVRGTRELAELARKMPQLKAFIHVSTAFANCHLSEINEQIYDVHFDAQKVIAICENQESHKIEEKISRLYPNMYIFTKNLSEKLISQYAGQLPIAVVRPSIITPSLSDPYPGWMDSKNGPMGLLMGAAVGLIRSAYGFKWAIADFIPVDKVANGIIAVAAEVGDNRTSKCPVYNLTSSNEAPITWHHFLEMEKEIVIQDPYTTMVWYPGGGIHENRFTYYISFLLFQLLPSLVGDCILLILRKRPWLLQLQIKAFQNLELLSYFISHTWKWRTHNCNTLFHKLNFNERSIFNFKMYNMDYSKYFRNWHAGSKKFFLKMEEPSRRTFLKLKVFYCLESGVKMLCYFFVGYVLLKIFGRQSIVKISNLDFFSTCTNAYTSLKAAYLD